MVPGPIQRPICPFHAPCFKSFTTSVGCAFPCTNKRAFTPSTSIRTRVHSPGARSTRPLRGAGTRLPADLGLNRAALEILHWQQKQAVIIRARCACRLHNPNPFLPFVNHRFSYDFICSHAFHGFQRKRLARCQFTGGNREAQ